MPQYPMTAVSLAHSATQTDARISCSTGSQTAFDVSSVRSSLDVSTQTGQPLFLQCGVSEGLDSLEPFLQHEHNLAQARAHRRVLLMRLLRELRALNMTKTSGDRLAESHTASIATQTETFCSATKKGRELTPEEWTPFVSAAQAFVPPSLSRAQSYPCSQQENIIQKLQPSASAPHPIDDIIGCTVPVDIVPALVQAADAAAAEDDGEDQDDIQVSLLSHTRIDIEPGAVRVQNLWSMFGYVVVMAVEGSKCRGRGRQQIQYHCTRQGQTRLAWGLVHGMLQDSVLVGRFKCISLPYASTLRCLQINSHLSGTICRTQADRACRCGI